MMRTKSPFHQMTGLAVVEAALSGTFRNTAVVACRCNACRARNGSGVAALSACLSLEVSSWTVQTN